jgi:hypothetical protein
MSLRGPGGCGHCAILGQFDDLALTFGNKIGVWAGDQGKPSRLALALVQYQFRIIIDT